MVYCSAPAAPFSQNHPACLHLSTCCMPAFAATLFCRRCHTDMPGPRLPLPPHHTRLALRPHHTAQPTPPTCLHLPTTRRYATRAFTTPAHLLLHLPSFYFYVFGLNVWLPFVVAHVCVGFFALRLDWLDRCGTPPHGLDWITRLWITVTTMGLPLHKLRTRSYCFALSPVFICSGIYNHNIVASVRTDAVRATRSAACQPLYRTTSMTCARLPLHERDWCVTFAHVTVQTAVTPLVTLTPH